MVSASIAIVFSIWPTAIVDQRWLTWLAGRTEPAARSLLRDIRKRLPDRWLDARRLGNTDLAAIRNAIIAFAKTAL